MVKEVDTYPCLLCQDNKVRTPEEVCSECSIGDEYKCPSVDCDTVNDLKGLKSHHAIAHNKKIPNMVCEYCGKTGHKDNERRSFCDDCHEENNHRPSKRMEDSICEYCDEEFEYYPEDSYGKFCSEKCMSDYREENQTLEVECDYCDDNIIKPKNRVERNENNFCDVNCYKQYVKENKGSADMLMSDHPKDKGDFSELAVIGQLSKYGIVTLDPNIENLRYDFVVDSGDSFHKIQCKHGRLNNGSVSAQVSSSFKHTTVRETKETYQGDVDYFVIYCSEIDQVFLVPVGEVGDKKTFTIRIEESRQTSNINKAENYKLENRKELDEWSKEFE